MATTLDQLLTQHPTNPVRNPEYKTDTNKDWTLQFHPITNLIVHTYQQPDNAIVARFDGPLLPEYEDDVLRKSQLAYPPNRRSWRLDTEEDITIWFHTEMSNIVLAGWTHYPGITQVSQAKPFNERPIPETVDVAYTTTHEQTRFPVIIGEMKRNLVARSQWQQGRLRNQQMLSRELRGYAHKYDCPQIFCFDGGTLLLLQFRSFNAEQIKDQNYPVDCWVLPRKNEGGCPLRYAFYRFLSQGFRRFQSQWPINMPIGGMLPYRLFFNGQPIWRVGNTDQADHPEGYQRDVDPDTGAFYWKLGGNSFLSGSRSSRLWDTLPLWDVQGHGPI